MLLIWFNPTHGTFYIGNGSSTQGLKLGDTNGFGHILVSIYVRKGLNYVSCTSLHNAYVTREEFRLTKKNRLITHVIELLDKERRK